MAKPVLKMRFTIALCVVLATSLAGCGRKPKLSDLKAPQQETSAAIEAPAASETIDGVSDGLEPVAQTKPKRGFFLDFLL